MVTSDHPRVSTGAEGRLHRLHGHWQQGVTSSPRRDNGNNIGQQQFVAIGNGWCDGLGFGVILYIFLAYLASNRSWKLVPTTASSACCWNWEVGRISPHCENVEAPRHLTCRILSADHSPLSRVGLQATTPRNLAMETQWRRTRETKQE